MGCTRGWWPCGADSAVGSVTSEDAVSRILRAPDAFSVLGLPAGSPESSAEVRTAYKRLALRVHPDKVRDCNPSDAKAAFERLEAAARAVEAIEEHNGDACRELHRVLRCDPFTLRGASSILQVDPDAEECAVKSAVVKMKEALSKAQVRDAEMEVNRGLEACHIAQETLRIAQQSGSKREEGERLLAEGVGIDSLSAMGLRDMREIGGKPIIHTASWRVGEALRVALCCGATARLDPPDLQGPASLFPWQPRAAALQWAAQAFALSCHQSDSSASAICICLRDRLDEDGEANVVEDFFAVSRPAKRQKISAGPRSVRVRHLLLRCAEAGKAPPDDPMARRPKSSSRNGQQAVAVRTPAEAEAELVTRLENLQNLNTDEGGTESQRLTAFRKLCQQCSECSSADNAGQLCGDLGWISRGQAEPPFEQAAFSLRTGELSDVVTTSRGVHLIQRLA